MNNMNNKRATKKEKKDTEDHEDTKDTLDIKGIKGKLNFDSPGDSETVTFFILVLGGKFEGIFKDYAKAKEEMGAFTKNKKDDQSGIHPLNFKVSYVDVEEEIMVDKENLVGDLSDIKCPLCHATLLINPKGHLWCSRPGCIFGLWKGFHITQWDPETSKVTKE